MQQRSLGEEMYTSQRSQERGGEQKIGFYGRRKRRHRGMIMVPWFPKGARSIAIFNQGFLICRGYDVAALTYPRDLFGL